MNKADKFDEIQSRVTDLNQRMCHIEKQQALMGVQITDINASLSKFSDENKRRHKFYITHMTGIGIGTTILITIALILFHMIH